MNKITYLVRERIQKPNYLSCQRENTKPKSYQEYQSCCQESKRELWINPQCEAFHPVQLWLQETATRQHNPQYKRFHQPMMCNESDSKRFHQPKWFLMCKECVECSVFTSG